MKLSQKASMICMGLEWIFFQLIIFFKMQFCCMNRTLRARSSHAIKNFFILILVHVKIITNFWDTSFQEICLLQL